MVHQSRSCQVSGRSNALPLLGLTLRQQVVPFGFGSGTLVAVSASNGLILTLGSF